jgi:hypothetical protein
MNPTKLFLHFSEFATIFYTFYKFLQNCNTIEDELLHRDPCNFSKSHTYTLRSHKTPWKDLGSCNATLGRGGGAAPANAGEPAALPAWQAVGLD